MISGIQVFDHYEIFLVKKSDQGKFDKLIHLISNQSEANGYVTPNLVDELLSLFKNVDDINIDEIEEKVEEVVSNYKRRFKNSKGFLFTAISKKSNRKTLGPLPDWKTFIENTVRSFLNIRIVLGLPWERKHFKKTCINFYYKHLRNFLLEYEIDGTLSSFDKKVITGFLVVWTFGYDHFDLTKANFDNAAAYEFANYFCTEAEKKLKRAKPLKDIKQVFSSPITEQLRRLQRKK
jgi:hypothetical protein